jgi:broad specificity phosphatase PhoE
MNVYLFRHGEVENPQKILYGYLPGFHLNEIGREHILKTTQKLIGKNIKKIYSSPLERTVETSRIIMKILGLKEKDLIIDNRLTESDCRKWQGTPLLEFKEKVVYKMSPKDQKEIELITDAGARILSVLNDQILKNNEDVIVVSHGDPLTGALIKIINNWSIYDNRYIKKGEFAKISRNGNFWKIEEFSYSPM